MKKAFYYCWYALDRHWNEGTILKPKRGIYSSSDTNVIKDQVDFAKKNDISNFCVSWWGIDSYEDLVLKNNLYPILKKQGLELSILFETSRYIKGKRINKEDICKIVKEIEYISTNYKQENLEIFLYLTRVLENIDELMTALNGMKKKYPFLKFVGDEVYWCNPQNAKRLKLFDKISIYNPHISNGIVLNNFWENIFQLYSNWNNFCKENNIDFVPTVIPGFNDSAVRPLEKHPVIERNITKMNKLIADLNGIGLNNIYICSFNEWHENTQIEP